MRLFVALEIPSTVRENLSALIQELRPLAPESPGKGPRWVRAENLHLTLKFIGEAAPGKLDGIRSALARIRSEEPVALDFHGLGFFPNEKHPRVLWAGMEASPNLKALAAGIEAALEKLGIPREHRSFAPHLTLARFQMSQPSEKLRAAIEENAQRYFGSLHTSEFHLIESKLKPSGAEYTTLQSFSFVMAEA